MAQVLYDAGWWEVKYVSKRRVGGSKELEYNVFSPAYCVARWVRADSLRPHSRPALKGAAPTAGGSGSPSRGTPQQPRKRAKTATKAQGGAPSASPAGASGGTSSADAPPRTGSGRAAQSRASEGAADAGVDSGPRRSGARAAAAESRPFLPSKVAARALRGILAPNVSVKDRCTALLGEM